MRADVPTSVSTRLYHTHNLSYIHIYLDFKIVILYADKKSHTEKCTATSNKTQYQ